MNLSRRHFLGGLCACGSTTLMGCIATGDQLSKPVTSTGALEAEPPVGYRPPAGSSEASLWFSSDRIEAQLKRSQFVVRDPALNDYVTDMACRLGGDHCRDMRVYVTRQPVFNASMLPNGVMTVNTGLLLRAENEAEVAAVIGHEIGHYLRRHSLYRHQAMLNSLGPSLVFAVAFGALGVPAGGDLANLAIIASQFAYSREHEREADRYGQQLMARNGYELQAAEQMWRHLIAEAAAMPGERSREIVFATHPDPENRIAELAARRPSFAVSGSTAGRDRFLAATRGARLWMVRDEVRKRTPGPTLVLLDRLLRAEADNPVLLFGKGEVHRLRDAEGDAAAAATAFTQAVAAPDAPPIAWRSFGFLEQRRQNYAAAAAHFRAYLDREREAEDRALLEGFIRNGGKPA